MSRHPDRESDEVADPLTALHHVGRFADGDLLPHPVYGDQVPGLSYAPFVTRRTGSVHTNFGVLELAAGTKSETMFHAFEKGVFVMSGTLDLMIGAQVHRLGEGHHALIPTGTTHAFHNPSESAARWVMVESPQPKLPDTWRDTWFSGPCEWPTDAQAPDLADIRTTGLGKYADSQLPPTSEVVPDNLYGFSMRMLMDGNFGATHFFMFIIDFPDGGMCNHHDHPFEEAYFILEGAVDCEMDGRRYTLEAGDYAWTGVGSRHGFFPKEGRPVRWLEVQVPQPPRREWQRWFSQWDYIETTLRF